MTTTPTKPSKAPPASETLRKLQEVLGAKQNPEHHSVELGTPVPETALAEWETKNRIKLPSAFRRFLLEHGSMAIWDEDHEASSYATFPLRFLMKETTMRVEEHEAEYGELDCRLLAFQCNPYDDNVFVFVLSKDGDDEPPIGELDSDEEFVARGAVHKSFDQHISEIAEEILENV